MSNYNAGVFDQVIQHPHRMTFAWHEEKVIQDERLTHNEQKRTEIEFRESDVSPAKQKSNKASHLNLYSPTKGHY